MDASRSLIARDIPSLDEVFVVIRFADSRGLVFPGGEMSLVTRIVFYQCFFS